MSSDIYLHTMNSSDLFKLRLECHRAAVALHRAETFDSCGFKLVRINELSDSTILCYILDTPFHIDGWEFVLTSCPYSECDENNSEDGRNYFPYAACGWLAYSDVKSLGRTSCNTLTAECTVNICNLAIMYGLHINAVWTLLSTETAAVAQSVILGNVKNLKLRVCMENFEEITCDAECSKKNCPWNVCSEYSGYGIYSEKNTDPYPEFKRI